MIHRIQLVLGQTLSDTHRKDSLRTPKKGAETDISTLLGADILALLLQMKYAHRKLWNFAELRVPRSLERGSDETHFRERTVRQVSV
jgi:hypothetical protein